MENKNFTYKNKNKYLKKVNGEWTHTGDTRFVLNSNDGEVKFIPSVKKLVKQTVHQHKLNKYMLPKYNRI